jgi:hypothetical protein
MEAMGKGIASGISSVAGAYNEHKQEQAKFNATKKMVDVFGTSLNDAEKESIASIFADTSMSVKEKNALAPALMQFLGASQQQKGKEDIAKIMAGAGARRPQAGQGSTFGGVPTINDTLNLPVDGSQANPAALQQPQFSLPPAQQIQPNQTGQPASRIGQNGQMEVWSSRLNRFVELDNPMQGIQY